MNRLGADYVDPHLAPVAGTVSMAQLDRTVRHALIAFDPAEADRRDAADAHDLEHALRGVATQVRRHPRRTPLDGPGARRPRPARLGPAHRRHRPGHVGGRGVTLNLHLDAASGAVDLDQPGVSGTVTLGHLRSWCEAAGTSITVKPVIDLHQRVQTEACTPTARIRDHVEPRDRHYVAPNCTRPARACDLDHIDTT